MAFGKIFVVFVLPVILSVTLASAVMADVLDKPGRELQMWPPQSSSDGHGSPSTHVPFDDRIQIVGLEASYATSETLDVRIVIDDESFDCGDLYITIRDSGNVTLTQKAFFSQCFADGGDDLPVGTEFTAVVALPDSYTLSAEMRTATDSISALGEFTVE